MGVPISTLVNVSVPFVFDFEAAATGHGWNQLLPYRWEADTQTLHRVVQLASGRVVALDLSWAMTTNSEAAIQCQTPVDLTPEEQQELTALIQYIFRFEEDFTEFYQLCRDRGHPWSRLVNGAGRLLRSPTLFEDMVKTICTTNTTWAGTQRMVRGLVETLGQSCPEAPSLKTFPDAEAIAHAPEQDLSRLGLGYRGAYIQALARQVADGTLVLTDWHPSDLSTAELKKQLLALKGIGAYAAHTLLMLMGRYEELAIDSEMRAFTRQRYFDGQIPTDRDMRSLYQDWGRWKYLAYWFDSL